MPVRNLIFVAFVEPVADGQVFPRTEWPLHITLARFDVKFDAGSQESGDVAERIAGLADGAATAALGAPLTIGEEAGFGRNGSVPVNLVQPHPALQELHEQLVKLVPDVEGKILTPGHTLKATGRTSPTKSPQELAPTASTRATPSCWTASPWWIWPQAATTPSGASSGCGAAKVEARR